MDVITCKDKDRITQQKLGKAGGKQEAGKSHKSSL